MNTFELMRCIGQIDDAHVLCTMDDLHAKPHRPKRWLLLAAIIAVWLLLMGCAVGYILYNGAMMETIFGTNGRRNYQPDQIWGMFAPGGERTELDMELAEKYITPNIISVNQTLSEDESTLTVLSCLVDRTACVAAVYMKLENPPEYTVYNSGQLLFNSERISDCWYITPRCIGQDDLIGRCVIDEASTTDTELYFVFLFSCEPGCSGLDLSIHRNSKKIHIALPEGTDLSSIALADGQVLLSPLGMNVSAALLMQDDDPLHLENTHREIALQFRDGTEYLVRRINYSNTETEYIGFSYGMALNSSSERYVFLFNRIVEPEEIAAFRLNDHIYTR